MGKYFSLRAVNTVFVTAAESYAAAKVAVVDTGAIEAY